MAKPAVSIIIVNYNTRDLTLACIESVFRETTISFQLIVLDNNSSDGSFDAIADRFPSVQLIRSDQNNGFAKGNNIAAVHATAELILLLNPDTLILENAIDKLVDFSQQSPSNRIWGGRTVFPDGSLNPTSCWRKTTLWSLVTQATGLSSLFRNSAVFNPEAYGGWKRDRIREVDVITGCFLLVQRSLWSSLGGFDETFFMYGEEVDLCLRAKIYNASPILYPDACIIHYGGASERSHPDKGVRIMRAKVRLIYKHTSRPRRYISILLLASWPLSRSFASRAVAFVSKQEPRVDWAQIWQRRNEWLTANSSDL